MARSKKTGLVNGHEAKGRTPSPESERPAGPLSIAVGPGERDVVKVNNYNSTELKNACDDALRRYLSRPELFKQIHQHTDVRLALGWLSVFIAVGTSLYGYKVEFEKSKLVVTIGLVLYMVLTTLQTLYAYFIEGNTIFVGKRKTLSKRIITERIELESVTAPPSKYPSKEVASPANAPSYRLTVSYMRSTNAGKSLLAKGRTNAAQPYSAFFDENGTMDQEAFERWLGELVESTMNGKLA